MNQEQLELFFEKNHLVSQIYVPVELSELYKKTRASAKAHVKNYNGFVLDIINQITTKVHNSVDIVNPIPTDEILKVQFYNNELQDITNLTSAEIISHIEFTITYYENLTPSINNKNIANIEHIIRNIFNNCLFIEENNNFNFTITYVTKSVSRIANKLESKTSYLCVIPTVSNNASSIKISTNFAIRNYSKIVLLKDANEVEHQLSLFIKDNIERVFTNYKKYDITHTSNIPQNIVPDNIKTKLLSEVTKNQNDITTEQGAIQSIKTYSLEKTYGYIGILYDLPQYDSNAEKSKLFYFMFTYLSAQKYLFALEAMLYQTIQLYIISKIKDDIFIIEGDIVHQQIYDPVNNLLIIKVFKYSYSVEMLGNIPFNKLILCEITTIYDLKTDNLYINLIMHRGPDNDIFKFNKPVIDLGWLFSKPTIFFIDTYQAHDLGHSVSQISRNVTKRGRNTTLRKRKNNNLT